jgi:hypothetical protein
VAANDVWASVPGVTGYSPTGVVTLLSDYEVCKEGDVLTPEQARVLVSGLPGFWQEALLPFSHLLECSPVLLITLAVPYPFSLCCL